MRKTKIVCTLGPATDNIEVFRELVNCGMDVARFNFSHGDHSIHLGRLETLRQLREEAGKPIAALLDTKGPEIRVRQFVSGKVLLENGKIFTLTTRDVDGTDEIVSITYEGLVDDIKAGDTILIDDGLIELEVKEILDNTDIKCEVITGGYVSNNKGINVPDVEISMPYISEKDREDIIFGIENGFDFIAASFVRTAGDVLQIRRILEEHNCNSINIIAKIENLQGVEHIDEIIQVSDGIMVARGDMGVEIPGEEVPVIQKMIIKKVYNAGKQVITATQMLDSMIKNPRPTRAEATDVANAIYDGTSAIMLSGETSAGKYPVLSVETMRKIACETEKEIVYSNELVNYPHTKDVTCGIGYGACALATSLEVKAILVTTNSGSSAQSISRFRPSCDIIALTPSFEAYNKLGMLWGVTPLLDKFYYDTDKLLKSARHRALQAKLVKVGDYVIQTAGFMTGISGSNALVVSEIGEGDKNSEE